MAERPTNSSVATRRESPSSLIRGLKPTATLRCRSAASSLRDAADAVGVEYMWSHDDCRRLASTEHILLLVIDFVSVEKGAKSITRRSEEHTSELQSRLHLVCRLLLEKKKKQTTNNKH